MDPIFDLLSAYQKLPEGWGFPPAHSPDKRESPKARALRDALFPVKSEEGVAQLIRWYYGVIRAYPSVALGIGSASEEYDPGLAWKPQISIHSSEVKLTPDPRDGMLHIGWEPGANVRSLEGEIVGTGEAGTLELRLGGESYLLSYSLNDAGVCRVGWPEFLSMQAAFTAVPSSPTPIVLRPVRFDAASLAEKAHSLLLPGDLGRTGVSAEWPHASAEERVALLWAVIQDIRELD